MATSASTYASVRALIFDLFGVVIAFDEQIVYRRLAEHCAQPEEALAAMQDLVSRPTLIRGHETLEQLHEALVAAHGLRLSQGDFASLWRQPYTEPMAGMSELLAEVSQTHRLVLLSNVDGCYLSTVRCRHSELRYFSTALYSCETGTAKPERAAFDLAIRASDTTADRCLFIDDKHENVEAAERMGLPAYRFVDAVALRCYLAKANVLPAVQT